MIRFLFWIVVFGVICQLALAQTLDEKKFIHYTTKDGLSNNYITGLGQDSKGYIWISTSHGLNRFDGSTFKQFLHSDESNSIPDNGIFSMRLFPGDQLAIATEDGAQIISTKSLETKKLEVPTEDALRYWSNYFRYVCVDKEGNYGASTKTGFYIFSREGKLKKRLDHFTAKDIGLQWMMFGSRLYQMPDGNLMQENRSGFTLYDPKKNQFSDAAGYYPAITSLFAVLKKTHDRFIFISTYDLLVLNEKTNSFDIIDIRNGDETSSPACFNLQQELGWQSNLSRINDSIWVINSKNKGFYLIAVNEMAKTVVCSSKKYFSDHFCTYIFSDHKKRFWIGTNEGLFMEIQRPKIISTFDLFKNEENGNGSITSLYISEKKIFAGTDKKQIIVLDKQSKQVLYRVYLNIYGEEPPLIMSFLPLHADTLWVQTTSGLLWLHTRNYSWGRVFADSTMNKNTKPGLLFMDTKRNIWMGSENINTVYLYHPATGNLNKVTSTNNPLMKTNMVNSIAEDSEGNIWFGGDAIARWNPRMQKIDSLISRLPTQKNRKKGYSVMSDSQGNIWATVKDDGIAKITGTNSPVHVRPGNLLPDYSAGVYPALLQNKIFICINNAIGFLDIKDLRGIVLHQADGLPEEKITSFYFSVDRTDQSTWFACGNTVCKIPFLGNSIYAEPPVLNVSEVSAVKNPVINYPPPTISLKYYQNDIRITLSAIDFSDPENMRFAYRIKDKNDTAWTDIGTQQNILLTNISPGNYKLEVKVYAFDNKWPEQTKQINVVIQPPFWKTAWFLSAIVFLITGAIYYLYRYRIKQIKQKANLDKLLAQTEMRALHSQMNPHFIFNSLNSIMQMVLNDEKTNASRYLSNYAQLVRLNLEHSQRTFITLRENIDYLRLYIELEQTRTNSFVCSLEIDEDLNPDEILLPPMLIQPFIENAIWYGPSNRNLPMKLDIRFFKKNDQLVCLVDDNGMGIEASIKNKSEKISPHVSLGISNVKQRIRILNEKYGLHYSLDIEDKSRGDDAVESGTRVVLGLPLNVSYL